MFPQDGAIGSSKVLLARQRVTSDVLTASLDVCSAGAHSTRAIVLKLGWNGAVRQGNKFPRRVSQTTKSSLGYDRCRRLGNTASNRKTRKINNAKCTSYKCIPIHTGSLRPSAYHVKCIQMKRPTLI